MSSVRTHPSRPLVICLHSSGATGRQWQPLVERLAPAMRVVAPDLHGHGHGPAWSERREDILAADAALVTSLAREHVGTVHLIGHSWGGAVAMRAARRDPQRYASLGVYEPVLFRLLRDRGEREPAASRIAWIGRSLRADLRAQRRDLAARRFVDFWNTAGTFDAMSRMRRDAVATRMPAVVAHFTALWNDDAALSAYAALALPVRLYAGARTHAATRLIVELLATTIPGATVRSMPAMGHMGPLTHPHIVAQSMAAYVAAQQQPRASTDIAQAA